MSTYERDNAGVVGFSVCRLRHPTRPSKMAPPVEAYRMTLGDRFKQRSAHRRVGIERRLFPDPFVTHGQSCWAVSPPPPWLTACNCTLVKWMTGFRMSFRTELIRSIGFNQDFSGYGLFEDVEASFQISKSRLIVGNRHAQVFHHRFPGPACTKWPRGSGMMQILNRIYCMSTCALWDRLPVNTCCDIPDTRSHNALLAQILPRDDSALLARGAHCEKFPNYCRRLSQI